MKTMVLLSIVCLFFPMTADAQLILNSQDVRFDLSDTGHMISVKDLKTQTEYLATGQPAPLLQIRVNKQFLSPIKMETSSTQTKMKQMVLTYSSNIKVHVAILEKDSHVTFRLHQASDPEKIEMAVWGPYPLRITKTVGEFVGVVRDDSFAYGIQALNTKTIGGFPINEEGAIFSRGIAAEKKENHSVLQAFSLNRSQARNIKVLRQFPNMPIPPIEGETVIGSHIALFGCPENRALETIGKIELEEGLPHPMINGEWIKTSDQTGRSYLIASFSEKNIDTLLDHVERAGLMSLYHGHPFKTWGHFELLPDMFPNGYAGMKSCVEKAKARGVRIGAHVLTNFITTNDLYVTPVPDQRLALTGSSTLSEDISEQAAEIPVDSNEYFKNKKANWLRSVRIGEEIIRYRSVTENEPYLLQECQRGAFGTKARSYKKGEQVSKLLDHAYKVFFPNWEMQPEMVDNLARFFNETGVSHMDFDGHEGCYASGQGDMAVAQFADELCKKVNHVLVNGSSRSSHYYWHLNHYLNWGEPWYGGFRESMQEYRINNQDLLKRNYMPNMLGWYLMTETTSLSEMEWMLARAAGYDAGFAMATSPEALKNNPDTDLLMDTIREWESARRCGAFSPEQQEQLKDPKNEFHLEKVSDGVWDLYPFHLSKSFIHKKKIRQPGEPVSSSWEFFNPNEEQAFQFRLVVTGESGTVSNPTFEVDDYYEIRIPASLQAGESLVSDKQKLIRIYDKKGRQRKVLELSSPLPKIKKGSNKVSFDGEFSGDLEVVLNFKTRGKAQRAVKN